MCEPACVDIPQMRKRRTRAIALMLCVAALAPQQEASAQGGTWRIQGTVRDSLENRLLPDASVQLANRADPRVLLSATTDSLGRFELDSVPAGEWLVGFQHPWFDSVFVVTPVTTIQLNASTDARRTRTLDLRGPGRWSLLRAWCGPNGGQDSLGAIVGHIRVADDGRAARRARTTARWTEFTLGRGVARQVQTAYAESDTLGTFVLCGIPADAPVSLQTAYDADSSGVIELDIPPSGILRRDLWVGRVLRDSASDTLDALLRGNGTLRGTVRSAAQQPVAGATVRVRGGAASTATDATGAFALGNLPTGTHPVDVTAVGFQPRTLSVDIAPPSRGMPDRPLVVQLSAVDVTLDTMRVTSTRRRAPWQDGFDARRKMGMGRFVDAATIERRNPMMVADVLGMLPGLTIREGQFYTQRQVLMRTNGGYCAPNLVVDGQRTALNGMSIDMLVSAQETAAIEVYRSAILTPGEFGPMGAGGCGTIVIWRGMRERQR